jgi:hypothetical protein
MSNKTSTNLAETPDIQTTLFEPIESSKYDLGSAAAKWSDIYAHKIHKKGFPLVTLIPNAYASSTAASPPANQAANGGMEFFIEAISSTNFTVYKYINDAPTVVDLPQSSLLFYTLTAGTGISYIAYRAPDLTWLRRDLNLT